MSGASLSKATAREIWKSDQEQREAILHHTEALGVIQAAVRAQEDRIKALEGQVKDVPKLVGWVATMQAIPWWRRIQWLLTGR